MTEIRLAVRKTRSHLAQMICLILLLMVGVCFFITLFTVSRRYEEAAEEYFADNAYADVTFYGLFSHESQEILSAQEGMIMVQGRTVRDFREEELIYRVISLTDRMNLPYVYEGRLPEKVTECLLLRRNAAALELGIGDVITLAERELVITGLGASPEYIYMVQNERTMMAQPDSFAVLYVVGGFFPEGYNEIIALTAAGCSPEEAAESVGAFQATLREDQVNHTLYRNDLEEISTFAYIFPLIFAVLIAAVVYVMLARTIQKDRKQIGTMKALGMPDRRIVSIYLIQYGLAAMVGGLLGCFLAMLAADGIIGIFASMFEVPALGFTFYPSLWAGAVAVVIALCVISGLAVLLSILSLLPAQAMRPRVPRGSRRGLVWKADFFSQHLSWGTRYALKNSLRSKGRFFAVITGMCGSCALLVFSLGFYDSIGNTRNQYFNNYANYDIIINLSPLPLSITHPAIDRVDSGYKALVLPGEIRGEKYPLAIVEPGFDMVKIPTDKLQSGVILPDYFARQWQIDVGDRLEIDGYAMTVSAISPQYVGLTFFTSFDYMNTITDELPPVYNTIYARSGDRVELTGFLENEEVSFSTVDDDRTGFESIMESMSVLIWFMIAASMVLGFTVLYSVGLISLSAREYEYMFMGIMGFSHRGILTAHCKETLLQLILAVPLGFLTGNLLLASIKGEFSGSSFVIAAAIRPQSYGLAALAVVGVTLVMGVVTSRHINRLDIVEGLKAQDE